LSACHQSRVTMLQHGRVTMLQHEETHTHTALHRPRSINRLAAQVPIAPGQTKAHQT
jgi:hypothetical protein